MLVKLGFLSNAMQSSETKPLKKTYRRQRGRVVTALDL